MKGLILCLFLLVGLSFTALAGFEGKSAGASLKIFNQINCGAALTAGKIRGYCRYSVHE